MEQIKYSREKGKRYHSLYFTINKLNGKVYVGRHSSNTSEDRYLGSGIAITAAIKKYGRENFSHFRVAMTNIDFDMLCRAEEYLIAFTKHFYPENYNISDKSIGSKDGTWFDWTGVEFSDIHKQRISTSMRNNPNNATNKSIVCPHCNTSGNIPNMKRWHLDNCKRK